jgi:hypothetical protein
MTYRINKTDGNQLVDIPDGTFDNNTTSLTLIGKNVTSFGEILNENLVKLLENFASSSAPEQALKGQLWYDASTGRLNVYDGVNFRAAGGPIVTPTVPTELITGDLWINNETNQMYMYDGTDLILVGPLFTYDQGTSGFQVESVLDIFNRTQVIVKLYVSNLLIGIFSKATFVPSLPIEGYTSFDLQPVKIGFNIGSFAGLKFDVTVTRTESILTDTGDSKLASQLVYNDEDNVIIGTDDSTITALTIQKDNALNLGATEDVRLRMDTSKFIIETQNNTRSNIGIRVRTPAAVQAEAITIDATTSRVGIFLPENTIPESTFDVNGDIKVRGNLIVEGDTVTINVSELTVEDKNILLGASSSLLTDLAADGGGISLQGATDKTFNWYNATSSWTSSEHINVNTGKTYKIGGTTVLTNDTLGAGILTSSLTSLGNLLELNMDSGLTITQKTIQVSSGNIVLNPIIGSVDVSERRIINLDNPQELQDAATKTYVDDAVFRRPISLSMDITGLQDDSEIAAVLDGIAPFYNPITAQTGTAINGTRLVLHTTKTVVTNGNITYSPTEDTEFTRIPVITPTGTESVVRDISTNQIITAPVATVSVIRQNKLFIMGGTDLNPTPGEWGWVEDLEDPYTTL